MNLLIVNIILFRYLIMLKIVMNVKQILLK